MSRHINLALIRSAAIRAAALLVIGYFAWGALVGPNGLMSLAGYREQHARQDAVLRRLMTERDVLAHHAALLDPRHVDPDLADELVRRETGQIRPDEVIIPRD